MNRPVSAQNLRINAKIHAREVRLTGPDGQDLGALPLKNALALARRQGVDLIEITPRGCSACLPLGRTRQIPL